MRKSIGEKLVKRVVKTAILLAIDEVVNHFFNHNQKVDNAVEKMFNKKQLNK